MTDEIQNIVPSTQSLDLWATQPTSTASTRADLIKLLEFEIVRIQDASKKPGWTVWALAISVATVVWTIFRECETVKIPDSFKPLAILVLAFWFFWLLVEDISRALLPWAEIKQLNSRFWYVDRMLRSARPSLLAMVVWEAVLLSTFVHFSLIRQPFFYWCVMYSLILRGLVGNTVGFLLSYMAFPISPTAIFNKPFFVGGALSIITNCLCVIGLSYSFIFLLPQSDIHEVRLAILIVVGVVLLKHLLNVRSPNPLLNTLFDLRRKLGLGQLSEHIVKGELEIALAGMNASDLLRGQMDAVLTKRRQLLVLTTEILASLSALKPVISTAPKLTNEQRILCRAVLDSAGRKVQSAKVLTSELLLDTQKLAKRVSRLASFFPHAAKDVQKAFDCFREQLTASNSENIVPVLDQIAIQIGDFKKLFVPQRTSTTLANSGAEEAPKG
jgi:hypothetical protein